MAWLVPREDLTTAQLRAVELNTRGHKVILGGPGSGKTLVLLHRVRYLADEMNTPPERFRIFVYTKVLKEYIKAALSDLGLPHECTINFDLWCREFYKNNISTQIPRKDKAPDFDKIRQEILYYLSNNASFTPIYDYVMVDEGQDLDEIAYGILTRISKHVTVCMDNNQQLYRTGSTEKDVLKYLGASNNSVALLEAYRCSPYIINLAATMLPENERSAFISQARTRTTNIQTPLFYYAEDWQEEQRHMIEIVKTRIMRNESVAILLPKNNMVYGYTKALKEASIDVEDHQDLDFNKNTPKVLTYHSAKGLTFDSVLLPRLVSSSFGQFNEDEIRRQIFVGITRAQSWVYLSTTKSRELSLLERIRPLALNQQLTIREYGYKDTVDETNALSKEEDDFWNI